MGRATCSTSGQLMTPASVVLHQLSTPLLLYQGYTGHQQCREVHGLSNLSNRFDIGGHKGHQHYRRGRGLAHLSLAHQGCSWFVHQGHRGHHHCRGVQRPSLSISHPTLGGSRASLHTSAPRTLSWREFVLTVQTFGTGVKTMYNDMKLMKQYISQYGGLKIEKSAPTWINDKGKTTLMYPRKEMQFMYRV